MQMNEAGAPRFYAMPLDENDHGQQGATWLGVVDEESGGIVATAGTTELAERIRVLLDETTPNGETYRRWVVTAPCWRCGAQVRGERGGEDWEDEKDHFQCPGSSFARTLFHVPAAELRCVKCSQMIKDAETASLPTDGTQLCRDCGDPDWDEEQRACGRCGDLVRTLSSRDWCAACEEAVAAGDPVSPPCQGFPGACGAGAGEACAEGCLARKAAAAYRAQ